MNQRIQEPSHKSVGLLTIATALASSESGGCPSGAVCYKNNYDECDASGNIFVNYDECD